MLVPSSRLWLSRGCSGKMAGELVEAMNMVKSFRVSDLQMLLSSVGRSKSGLKQDLVSRALRLVQSECSPDLLKKIRQLYESRFPKKVPTVPAAVVVGGQGGLAPRRVTELQATGRGVPTLGVSLPPVPGGPDFILSYPSSTTSAPAVQRSGARTPAAPYINGLDKTTQNRQPTPVVRFVNLPFYHTLEVLLSPTELVPQNNEKLQDSPCTFELTQSQVDQIRNSRDLRPGVKSVQVVLRICYTDSSCPQEDQYPPNIAVKVNHSYCHVPGYYPSNKPGVEPRRPCRPINITPYLYLSTSTNRITVTWGNFGKRYCVALYLVQVFTSAELFSKLKRFSVESSERCRELIQDKLRYDPDSEIATTGLRVSLICPLVKMRLNVPCRALTCAHLQCFDAVFFLQMNEKKPTWTCPVCDKPAPFELLIIDGLLWEILKDTQDVEEIEYLSDGSWCPIKAEKEKEKEREQSNTPEYPVLEIGSPEENGHSPAHSSTSQNGKSAVGVVVDLTLDSSSEEEANGDSEGESEESEERPPQKRGRYDYDKDLVTAY
ncbi:E3 SUMO-protein ligase PIAS4-A [Erpetoichthys calabaricus]|uniref:RING-type E3 ubiquitin transferase n=1 Tax=Erpetoichthys calabaricus TaxID=27687 RepID=A0A8C4T4M3_ERPCA|nr:E3 SUMO-protein ligase PIAS4-A [Erpetoichthys calabaricus]